MMSASPMLMITKIQKTQPSPWVFLTLFRFLQFGHQAPATFWSGRSRGASNTSGGGEAAGRGGGGGGGGGDGVA